MTTDKGGPYAPFNKRHEAAPVDHRCALIVPPSLFEERNGTNGISSLGGKERLPNRCLKDQLPNI
jgi:hypothetical protein